MSAETWYAPSVTSKGVHMNGKLWCETDLKLLKSMSQYFTANQIAERLERTPSSIKNKLRELKIHLLDRGRIRVTKSSDWSEAEIKTLMRFAGKLPAHRIAKKIPTRSVKAIRIKSSRLGISLFAHPWSTEDMTLLLELHAQGVSFKEIGEKLNRSSDVCRAKFSYLNP